MDPKIPVHFWYILHIITFNYPDNPTEYQKNCISRFFYTFKGSFLVGVVGNIIVNIYRISLITTSRFKSCYY